MQRIEVRRSPAACSQSVQVHTPKQQNQPNTPSQHFWVFAESKLLQPTAAGSHSPTAQPLTPHPCRVTTRTRVCVWQCCLSQLRGPLLHLQEPRGIALYSAFPS